LTPERHIYLLFKNLYAEKAPGVLYRIYLDLPVDAVPEKNDPHYIGSLNFFQAGRLNESGQTIPEQSVFHSLDVTRVGKTLESRGLLSETISITVIPSSPPADGAKPRIGRIELVEQ
jgi:hypothetical protein